MTSSVSLDMEEVASSKNAALGAFGPSEQSEGAHTVQSPEAMAIEDNLASATRFLMAGFHHKLFFVSTASSRVLTS